MVATYRSFLVMYAEGVLPDAVASVIDAHKDGVCENFQEEGHPSGLTPIGESCAPHPAHHPQALPVSEVQT